MKQGFSKHWLLQKDGTTIAFSPSISHLLTQATLDIGAAKYEVICPNGARMSIATTVELSQVGIK